MNTKHTPGPWLVRFTLDKWCASYQIETTAMREPMTERAYLGECQATCVLLEATPDLLAALQLCSDFLEANFEPRDMPDILIPTRAALAKAKGEAWKS